MSVPTGKNQLLAGTNGKMVKHTRNSNTPAALAVGATWRERLAAATLAGVERSESKNLTPRTASSTNSDV